MKPILEIQNISKKFKLYHESGSYLSLRESLSSLFKKSDKTSEEFWALKDISFDVNPGDTVGIVGKNGAGKSTLLKILSKITPPTHGKIICRGRIASMLEVGTGFHTELSGRENIFLNGAILGMAKSEIKSKFDEIVEFSGVEKFLDTPLKHYSSGMQLRLAFSVSAHLDPEILIIDEVLAVGDTEFQKRCMNKMDDVSKQGRTILFVSHNMAAIKNLCKKGILLKNGMIDTIGPIENVASKYQEDFEFKEAGIQFETKYNTDSFGQATKLRIENNLGEKTNILSIGQPWKIIVNFTINNKTPHFIIGLGFRTMDNVNVRTSWSSPQDLMPGNYEAEFIEDSIILGAGSYKVTLGLTSREQAFQFIEDCSIMKFENFVDKSISLKSDIGIILNPMKVNIKNV